MGIFDRFKSKKKEEKVESDYMDDLKKTMSELIEKEGTTYDQLPGSSGEFGFSANNPILLTSIRETRIYLERLIYIQPGASMYEWERSGSTQNNLVSTPVDIYRLLDLDGNTVKTIYIWPYNKVNSTTVPEGFGLM